MSEENVDGTDPLLLTIMDECEGLDVQVPLPMTPTLAQLTDIVAATDTPEKAAAAAAAKDSPWELLASACRAGNQEELPSPAWDLLPTIVVTDDACKLHDVGKALGEAVFERPPRITAVMKEVKKLLGKPKKNKKPTRTDQKGAGPGSAADASSNKVVVKRNVPSIDEDLLLLAHSKVAQICMRALFSLSLELFLPALSCRTALPHRLTAPPCRTALLHRLATPPAPLP